MRVIHLQWEGPLTIDQAEAKRGAEDYGIYQFYGHHPAYGRDALLYLAKAQDRRFGVRIAEYHLGEWDNITSIHLGRISDAGRQPSAEDWGKLIEQVESLLIYAHKPSFNAKSIKNIDHSALESLHVLNWGDFRSLLPEVSGERFTMKYWSLENYRTYVEED